MAKKDKNKKGDDVLKLEMKQALEKEIANLEQKIFMEEQKNIFCSSQVVKRQQEMKNEYIDMEKLKLEENKKVNAENDSLKKSVAEYKSKVDELEKTIREQDDEIRRLENQIREKEIENKRELEEKDNLIAEQRRQFEDMSVRFQHILQRTANKLQERVDMGR